MKPDKLIKVAWKALQLNKVRTFLTMLGIIIGVASVITMMAIGEGSKQSIHSRISSMGSNMINIRPGAGMMGGIRTSSSGSEFLTYGDLKALKKESTLITNISPMINSGGQSVYGSRNWPTTIMGVSPEYLDARVLSIKSGSMFTEIDVNSAAKVVVLGQTVVDNLFTSGLDPVGQTIRFNRIPFKVIGVINKKGESNFGQDQDDVILAPYTSVQKRLLATTYLQSIVVSAKSEAGAPDAVQEVTQIMRRSHKLGEDEENDFNVFSQEEIITTMSSTSTILTYLLVAIASISLLVGGIGIMNIMYVSVKERTREIGLRMAVGGRGIDILLQFLTEAILISFAGGIIGALLGIGATIVVTSLFKWPVSISAFSICLSFLVCAVTGIFFGWYPAKKASDLDPIIALHYE
jgi:putative ABC transport system permease protein